VANAPTLPAPDVLEEALASLQARGDHPSTVRVVEAWLAQGAPTPRARLLQARAFFALCQPDRAMVRAQEVLDADPRDHGALRLLAEVYLARGWPTKARKPLTALRELGEDVSEAWERAHADPVRVDANVHEMERSGSPAEILALAEALLRTGSHLRARGLLERLARAAPDDPRPRQLLWALEGDYGASPVELALIVQDAALGDGEEPEHTETVVVASRPAPAVPVARGFPTLFPGEDDTREEEPHEVTQTSVLATDTGGAPTGGDTQIMLVIRPGERPVAPSGPTHVRREVTETGAIVERNLDLAAWKAQMGMRASPQSDLDEGTSDLLEAEDEHVVVMTRPETDAPSEDSESFDGPIEVVERIPVPVASPVAGAPATGTGAPMARVSARVRALALAGVGLGAAAGAWLFLGSAEPSPDALRARVVAALATQDVAQWSALEEALRQEAQEQRAVSGALALTRMAIWEDAEPAPGRREYAEGVALIPDGARDGTDWVDPLAPRDRVELDTRVALALGQLSVAERALPALTAEGHDAESSVVASRVALALGRADDAARLVEGLDASQPRYALAVAEARLAQGRLGDALALLRAQANPFAAVRLDTLLQDGIPDALWPAAERTTWTAPAVEGLPPRLAAALWTTKALRARATGDAKGWDEALTAAVAAAPDDPRVVRLAALRDLEHGKRVAAADALARASERRPRDGALRVALVLVLLELDRVVEAGAVVGAACDLSVDDAGALAAIVALGRGETPAELPSAATPLAAWATALRALHTQDAGAGAALQAAARALEGASDPYVRRLAPLSRALVPLTAWSERPARIPTAEELDAAVGLSPDDARVHVAVARAWQRAGNLARAAQHLDRAVELGPEYAVAWSERALLYARSPGGATRAEESRQRYLALAPVAHRTHQLLTGVPR